jgi:hypothetical protein
VEVIPVVGFAVEALRMAGEVLDHHASGDRVHDHAGCPVRPVELFNILLPTVRAGRNVIAVVNEPLEQVPKAYTTVVVHGDIDTLLP